MKNTVVVNHARSGEQTDVLKQIIQDGVCPFCGENLMRYHTEPIVVDETHWFATPSRWPYANASIQILIISKRHVENVSELTFQEWANLGQCVSRVMAMFQIDSGAFCMRFGDPLESGASVRHLHGQIIVKDPKSLEPVRYKIGGKKE